MKDDSGRARRKILADCLLLFFVCATAWVCFSLRNYRCGDGLVNAFCLYAIGVLQSLRSITFDGVFMFDLVLYGVSCALLYRQGLLIRSFIKAVCAMAALAVLCLVMWAIFPRSSSIGVWGVLLGMWVVAFSGVMLVSLLNLVFLLQGMRLIGIALLLLFGGWLYAVVEVRFDREPICVNYDPIRPLHVVNQLVGISLPSRGTLPGSALSSGAAGACSSGASAMAGAKSTRSDGEGGSLTAKPKEVMAFEFVHLLFYLYFIAIALSFANKEMLHRIIVKIFAWRKVHLFWDGSGTREASQYAAESLDWLWDDAVIVVDGRRQDQQANLCDRLTCKWITADVKTQDDVVSISRCHYFLGADGNDNALRAAELKTLLDGMWGRNRFEQVEIFVKVDDGTAANNGTAHKCITEWMAAQVKKADDKKDYVRVRAVRESDLIAHDCVEKIDRVCKIDAHGSRLPIGFIGDRHYFEALSRAILGKNVKLVDLGEKGVHNPGCVVVAYDDMDKTVEMHERLSNRKPVFLFFRSPTVSAILGVKTDFVFGRQKDIYTVSKIRKASRLFT